VCFALPNPAQGFDTLRGTKLEALAEVDPTRVLYNALIPFAVASLESFFSQCFKILLRCDPAARKALANNTRKDTRKVELSDVVAIKNGSKSLEDVVASWYSFQNIDSIQKAFTEWFGIDVRKTIRKRKKIGNNIRFLDDALTDIINFRHGIIHRFDINRGLTKEMTTSIFDTTSAIIEAFVDELERVRGKPIRD
jgi:hypothetical protein